MGVGAGLSMYVVVVQKFTFAISSPDEFLLKHGVVMLCVVLCFNAYVVNKFDDNERVSRWST